MTILCTFCKSVVPKRGREIDAGQTGFHLKKILREANAKQSDCGELWRQASNVLQDTIVKVFKKLQVKYNQKPIFEDTGG